MMDTKVGVTDADPKSFGAGAIIPMELCGTVDSSVYNETGQLVQIDCPGEGVTGKYLVLQQPTRGAYFSVCEVAITINESKPLNIFYNTISIVCSTV